MMNPGKFLGPIYAIIFLICLGMVGLVSSYIMPHSEILGTIWLLVGSIGSMYVAGSTKIAIEDRFYKVDDKHRTED
jgi:uncharacterized membrane protein